MKIGAITIGQSPRVDITCDIMDILGEDVELLERGGLDGLTRSQIETFVPAEGDYVLVSRLTDGSSVTFAERYIVPRLKAAVESLEEAGCRLIMVFCTGEFPQEIVSKKIPMVFPVDLLHKIVPILSDNIIAMTPSPLQLEQNTKKWSQYVTKVTSVAASPYGSWEDLEAAAEKVKDMDGDLIVLDCMGFTKKMKKMFAQKTGKSVLLPRTLLARVVSELTHDQN